MKKTAIYVVLVLMLLALLTGCGTDPAPTDPPRTGGTLYITVKEVVAVHYDADGRVTSITAVTEDAQPFLADYQDYSGKDCAQVVAELVTRIGEKGYLSPETVNAAVSITFEGGSVLPSEGFLKEVEQQAAAVIEEHQWQGTVTVEAPAAPEAPSTEPTTEPAGPSIPSNAQLQEDGTYILAEQLDSSQTVITDGDAPTYLRQTHYSAAGDPLAQELTLADTGILRARSVWEYDSLGLCIAHIYTRYTDSGNVNAHYREEYDADRLVRKIIYDKADAVSSICTYSYYDSGSLMTEEESSPEGTILSRKEYTESGALLSSSSFSADGTPKSMLTYHENGVTLSQTTWHENGVMGYYAEYYQNGNCKLWKRWHSNGLMDQEFVAFHDGYTPNGISTVYDENGNIHSIDTTGNPDGSPDTSEFWDSDGTRFLCTFQDGMLLSMLYTYTDGNTLLETYDYDAGTVRVTTNRENFSSDMVSSLSTGLYISGYIESTLDDGSYRYTEYADGYMYKEITDGHKNPRGYVYRETTIFYPSGQPMTVETYFYADGGRIYIEYDEDGNTTFFEDTTDCEYGVYG